MALHSTEQGTAPRHKAPSWPGSHCTPLASGAQKLSQLGPAGIRTRGQLALLLCNTIRCFPHAVSLHSAMTEKPLIAAALGTPFQPELHNGMTYVHLWMTLKNIRNLICSCFLIKLPEFTNM